MCIIISPSFSMVSSPATMFSESTYPAGVYLADLVRRKLCNIAGARTMLSTFSGSSDIGPRNYANPFGKNDKCI